MGPWFKITLNIFSAPAKADHLRIELTPDSRLLCARLLNCSEDQIPLLPSKVEELTLHGPVYRKPTQPCASAPLIVPDTGLAR